MKLALKGVTHTTFTFILGESVDWVLLNVDTNHCKFRWDRILIYLHLHYRYVYNIKMALDQPELASKLSSKDKKKLTQKCEEVLAWLESNQDAKKDKYDAQMKKLDAVAKPIMMKLIGEGYEPPSEEGL